MTREEMEEIRKREHFESVERLREVYCPFVYGYTYSAECDVYKCPYYWIYEQCKKCWADAVKEE